jgi:hypothetical protein
MRMAARTKWADEAAIDLVTFAAMLGHSKIKMLFAWIAKVQKSAAGATVSATSHFSQDRGVEQITREDWRRG